MSTWFPGFGEYAKWAGNENFLSHFSNSPDKQTIAIRMSIQEQTEAMSEHSKKIIASHEQIYSAIESGFANLSNVTTHGFREVTNSINGLSSSVIDLTGAVRQAIAEIRNVCTAVEDLHSDLNYHLGTLIMKIDGQNGILTNKLRTLESPKQTEVLELYKFGSDLLQQGRLEDAEQYLLGSISKKTGERYFPSHYLLGYLYLIGKNERFNWINPPNAREYLIKANERGEDGIKTNWITAQSLADCKFYLFLSYYFQLGDSKGSMDQESLAKAQASFLYILTKIE